MRTLLITPLQPPRLGIDVHGGYRRLAVHIRALQKLGASVTIAYYVTNDDVAPGCELAEAAVRQQETDADHWGYPARVRLIRRRSIAKTFCNYYLRGVARASEQPAIAAWAGPEQAEAIGAIVDEGYDLVVVNDLAVTCAFLRSRRQPNRVIFDLGDVQHLVRLRWCRQKPHTAHRLMMLSHIPALLAAELIAARRAEATLVCSELDHDHLARLGFPRLVVAPNSVDMPPEPPGPASEPTLLFVGSMGYEPNREAAERLVRRVFPLVLHHRPDARLLVAGLGSETLPSRTDAPKNVEFCGFVPDITSLYRRTMVFVCPMLNGGGTRIKLLDAAAYALPIVSTRMGAEGIQLSDNEAILLRDTDVAIAEGCLHLLSHRTEARRIGAASRSAVEAKYGANSVALQLSRVFAGSIAGAAV